MSDPRGFLKYPRIDSKYRPVAERITDFREVGSRADEKTVRLQATRCMDCGVAFCHAGCPLGNLIPEWNELARQGRWSEALDRLHATNNFPEFTSKLCPAPCESACVLDLQDAPVTIKSIEREIIDQGFERGLIQPRIAPVKTKFRIAIVGSGPAGLAAAQDLARRGHAVTVFEKGEFAGGLLRYGIPDFKMEKHVIDRRLDQLRAEGVEFRTSTAIGRDLSFARLRVEFDAVGLAVGAERPRDLEIPGRELDSIHFAMDYLIAQNQAIAAGHENHRAIDARDKTVIVIGGGDTGSDCVGTARRQGARAIHQFEILPEPPRKRSETTPWPHWPLLLRSSHAHEEGVSRHWSLATTKFTGDASGGVRGLVTERVQWDGARMAAVEGSETEVPADLVILALGFTSPILQSTIEGDFRWNSPDRLATDANLMTSVPGVFVGGDARRGASLIVWAIAEGKKMADGVHRWLTSSARAEAAREHAGDVAPITL